MKTLIFLILAMACSEIRAAVTVSVNGMCNVYGAGHAPPNNAPDVGPHGGGIAPVMISLAALSNAPALQFQASGTVSFCSGCGFYGPNGDGAVWAGPSYNGISGITNMPGAESDRGIYQRYRAIQSGPRIPGFWSHWN